MQVVLLAAGMGLRLGPLTRACSKAMIVVNGKPLLDYTLPHLLANKRVEEVIVAGGFEFAHLKEHVESRYALFGDRLRLVENRDFTKGNLYTLKAALPFLHCSFLLCNVDHLYRELTWKFILQERKEPSIFCDFERPLAPDEMKVVLDSRRCLLEMSKILTAYEAGYVGLTFIPRSRLASYKKGVKAAFERIGEKAVVENVLPLLAGDGFSIRAIPFDRHVWYEVDTPEDMARVKSALAEGAFQGSIHSVSGL